MLPNLNLFILKELFIYYSQDLISRNPSKLQYINEGTIAF